MANRFDQKNTATSTNRFNDNEAPLQAERIKSRDEGIIGIARNTVAGLPRALLKTGKDIVRGVTRNIASTGVSVANVFEPTDEFVPKSAVSKFALGAEPVKSVERRVAEAELEIKDSPTAQALKLDKFAPQLAFLGVVGGTALDLTPLGAGDDSIKALIKASDDEMVIPLLKKLGASDEIAQQFAPAFAKASSKVEVEDSLKVMGHVINAEKAGIEAAKNADPLTKLITAIRTASTDRTVLEEAYSVERSRRAGAIEQIFQKGEGEAGFKKAFGALKGELAPKPNFGAVTLNPQEIDFLANQIQLSKVLTPFEKITAYDGLTKLLDGNIPQDGQLSLLEDVFGSDLIKAVMDKRSFGAKAWQVVGDVANLPRTLISSVDMSAALRQGAVLTVDKPQRGLDAARDAIRVSFSEENFVQWFKDLERHPLYEKMRDSGLYIANPTKISGGLGAREEPFMSSLAEKFWIWGDVVKGSERNYVIYLNKLRIDTFADMVAEQSVHKKLNMEDYRAISDWVNTASGRGNLGKLERASAVLNATFFSPKLISSRFQMLNPVWYAKQTPEVRKKAIKTMGKYVATGITVLAIAKGAGAEVEVDPRSADFGKIKIGNTRLDIWGGFQQWVRLYAQLISGQRKSTSTGEINELSGDVFPFETRSDVAGRFFINKLAPFPALVKELADGQTSFGEPITLGNVILENTVPLYLQDLVQTVEEEGADALLWGGVPAFFGVGLQSYDDSKSKTKQSKKKKTTSGNRFNSN